MKKHALIAGVSGIIGRHLAEHLISAGGWEVSGISRNAENLPQGVNSIAADLMDRAALTAALKSVQPTHVFITTWSRQATEAENCKVTGLKHYLGPFEAYAKTKPITPFREEQPRLPFANFYYTQEDAVYAAAEKQKFTWSIHRPHTLIGYAVGNAMNMASTLAAYATICKETGKPFVFPGTKQQYEGAVDITDGRIIAKHLEWASTHANGFNEAFNIVNGEVFRWNWLWPQIAAYFGLTPAEHPGKPTPLESYMADAGPAWDRIVAKHGLKKVPIEKFASWWHTDLDLGRELESFASMTKSYDLGFNAYQNSVDSFTHAFDRLRQERYIP
jgi:nucleoside-diphosphate-sugar epimerase